MGSNTCVSLGGSLIVAPASMGSYHMISIKYRDTTIDSHLPQRAQHPRPHKSKQEEGARAWQDLQGQSYSVMHSTRMINTTLIQYLLHVAPCAPPDPRSGQAASKEAPPAVQAARAGLQPPPRPLSCCDINQSHLIPPVERQSAWRGLETWVA